MQTKTGLSPTNRPLSLSIIIPMYNEESRIEKAFVDLHEYFNSTKNNSIKLISKFEIIAVDDGSTDGTFAKVESLKQKFSDLNIIILKLDKNYGKGRAIKTGVLASSLEYILYIDADRAVPILDLESVFPNIEGQDIVIGSRKMKKVGDYNRMYTRSVSDSVRKVISRAGSLLNKTLVRGIKDTQCPFKLMKGETAKFIFQKMLINRYAFDLEMLFLAQKYKYKIKEVPVNYTNVNGSKFRIFRDVFLTFIDFSKIHLNNIFGVYR